MIIMYNIHITNYFKKTFKLAKKRGKNVSKLQFIIEQLQLGITLPEKHRDHLLIGNYSGYRECHIEPYWLLIYKVEIKEKLLILEATGSHSDLFK